MGMTSVISFEKDMSIVGEAETGKMVGQVKGEIKLTPLEEVIVDHHEITPSMTEILGLLAT